MNVDQAQRAAANNAQSPQGVAQNGNDIDRLFLSMLIAQIQNQDPTNPTDSTQYVNQLAQMTQVKSMEGMRALMQNNATLMDNLQVLSTAGLVGQQVMVQTEDITVSDKTINGRLTLQHPADKVTVIIKDKSGQEVKLELGKQDKGQVEFSIDPKKLGLKEGDYTLSVVTDTGEEKVPTEIAGVVGNVRIPLDGGATLLNIPGLGEVPFYKISQFGGNLPSDKSRRFA